MSGHTPGPWVVWAEVNVRALHGGRLVANAGGHAGNIPSTDQVDAENRANARLIAAAPELLEALTALIARLDRGGIPMSEDRCPACATDAGECPETCEVSRARAAIAKARGTT